MGMARSKIDDETTPVFRALIYTILGSPDSGVFRRFSRFLEYRVSTDDKGQDNETQLMHLREEARRRGYDIVKEYTDESSGKTVKGRVGYQSMMSDAKKHRFDMVMAYKLDRFHRNTLECLTFVNELSTMDVELVVTSQNIDTTTAAGRAMMQMIAVFAERSVIVRGPSSASIR